MTLAINLAGYYRLDEVSGNAIDSVSPNTLTANNSPGSGTGKIGNARTFNGSNQSFTAASSSVFNFGDTDFTIACWVNLSSVAAQSMLVTKFSTVSNQRQYALYYNRVTGRMSFLVNSSGASAQNVTINADTFGAIATSTWYYVVAWHDSVDNQIGISVNGVENTQSYSLGLFQSTASFRIGGRADSVEFTNGSIDGVGLWTKVLSSDERSRLYNDGNGLGYSRIIGATGIGGEVGWWCPSLDTIGNGTTLLNDLTGNGNNGTLTNMDAATDWVADTDSGGIRALDFDGVNDLIVIADDNSLDLVNAISLSCWIKFSSPLASLANYVNLIVKENYVAGNGYLLAFRTDQPGDPLTFRINGFNTVHSVNWNPGTFFDDYAWHHVCATYDKVNMRLYVDGVQRVLAAYTTSIATNTNAINLMARLAGRGDDFRVFNRAISSGEVVTLASQRGYQPISPNTRRRRHAGSYGL